MRSDSLVIPMLRAKWPRVRSLVPNTRPGPADGNNDFSHSCDVSHATPKISGILLQMASRRSEKIGETPALERNGREYRRSAVRTRGPLEKKLQPASGSHGAIGPDLTVNRQH